MSERRTVATRPFPSVAEPVYARDSELVKACIAGDDGAWRCLIGRYHRLIYSIPRSYGLDVDDAAEVYQAVCLALWKGLPAIRSEKALTRWIQTAAVRQSARLAQRRRRERPAENIGDRGPVDDGAEPVTERLERIRREHQVRHALDQLPDPCGRILKTLYLSDPAPSYDEAAIRLEIPRGSLGPTRARCLEKLRKLMISAK